MRRRENAGTVRTARGGRHRFPAPAARRRRRARQARRRIQGAERTPPRGGACGRGCPRGEAEETTPTRSPYPRVEKGVVSEEHVPGQDPLPDVQKAVCGVSAPRGERAVRWHGETRAHGALEESVAWSVRMGERPHLCRPSGTPVTDRARRLVTVHALSPADDRRRLAGGYADSVRIFELISRGASGDTGLSAGNAPAFRDTAVQSALAYDNNVCAACKWWRRL